jgi:hypothetical protein
VSGHDRFRAAARAYFVYGVVYWIGGVYLIFHGVGVRSHPTVPEVVVSLASVAAICLLPYLRERIAVGLLIAAVLVVLWFVGPGGRFIVLGAAFVVVIPFLLRRQRAWFERWILSRRDFARLLAAFMAFRAFQVGRIALRPDAASVSAPWGGTISFRAGAAVFFVVTVTALLFVVLAAWESERAKASPA